MNDPRMPEDPPAAPRPQEAQPERARPARAMLRSVDLLGRAQSVEIEHLGQIYRLQTTRAGKLILTK